MLPDQHVAPVAPPQLTVFEQLSQVVRSIPAWPFAFISLVVVFVLYQLVGGLATLLILGIDLTESSANAFRWVTMLGQLTFLLGPTLLLAKLRFPHVKNFFRFGNVDPVQLVLVVAAVFSLQQMLQEYMTLQKSIPLPIPPFVQDLIDKLKSMMEDMYRMLIAARSIPEFLFVVLVIAVTPAICEELLFRGLIQRTLEETDLIVQPTPAERRRRGLIAAVVSGIIFALYHLNPFAFVPLATLGIFFGFVVYRSQNIYTAMAGHFVNNFTASLALFLNLDDDFIAVAPTEHPTTEMLLMNFAVSVVVFAATTYYFVRRTKSTHADSVTI